MDWKNVNNINGRSRETIWIKKTAYMYATIFQPTSIQNNDSPSYKKKSIDELHLPLPKMQLSVYIVASVTQTLMLSANYNPREFLQQIHSHESNPAFWRFGLKEFSAQNDNKLFPLLHLRLKTPFTFDTVWTLMSADVWLFWETRNYPQFPLPKKFSTPPQMAIPVRHSLHRLA